MEVTSRLRSRAWLDALHALCEEFLPPSAVLVEIGSFAGESTAVFARHAATVLAVDPWRETYSRMVTYGCRDQRLVASLRSRPLPPMKEVERRFDRRVSTYRNVFKLRMSSQRAAQLIPRGTVDCVYIDGIHTYHSVYRDISSWMPKLRTGGVMAGHDYSPGVWPGVVAAVNAHFRVPDRVFADTSWAKRLMALKAQCQARSW